MENKDVSKKVVLILLVLTILISVIGTVIVLEKDNLYLSDRGFSTQDDEQSDYTNDANLDSSVSFAEFQEYPNSEKVTFKVI